MVQITETLKQFCKQLNIKSFPNIGTFDRPSTIIRDDGLSIFLEEITTHLTEEHCDRITIRTAKGAYVLNELADSSLIFIDGGYGFECNIEPRANRPTDYIIFYGSLELRTQSGLYSLLHELCHVTVGARRKYGSTALLENAVWDEADKLAVDMGLVLFKNPIEQQLYRDIHVRTYDLENDEGISYNSIVRNIHLPCFDMEVIFGLVEAGRQGNSLDLLCSALLAEREN